MPLGPEFEAVPAIYGESVPMGRIEARSAYQCVNLAVFAVLSSNPMRSDMSDFLRDHVDVILREGLQIARSGLKVSNSLWNVAFRYG